MTEAPKFFKNFSVRVTNKGVTLQAQRTDGEVFETSSSFGSRSEDITFAFKMKKMLEELMQYRTCNCKSGFICKQHYN